jgi:hypothetical protein
MKKITCIFMVILLGILSVLSATALAASDSEFEGDDPENKPPDAVGSYTVAGVFHWIVPGGDIKTVDFSGLTREEILKAIEMSPEDEAEIVHRVPSCDEIVIDGTVYSSEEIRKFDGQQLGFITGNDGRLYAFTTEEGFQKFKQE